MSEQLSEQKNDFSKGPMWKCIMSQAIPMTVAQLVHVLYNVVDRMYLGHLKEASTQSLTGVGIVLPVISFICACYALFSTGGAPLCSIARGSGDLKHAERIMGNTFTMLTFTGLFLMAVSYAFPRTILSLFGAGDQTMPFALPYFLIYMSGTLFSVLGSGMNAFINAQGFAKTGMMTTFLGSALNLVLDPLFIFVFDWGVQGAAAATVISQFASFAWVMGFILSKRSILHLTRDSMKLDGRLVGRICGLGLTGFIANGTGGIVQAVSNRMLSVYGGDLYIGVMTVVGSVREIVTMPLSGLTHGSQPVLGFNFGAKKYGRVREGIRFTTYGGVVYTLTLVLIIMFFPRALMALHTNDEAMIAAGIPCLRVYFSAFIAMAFMFVSQSTFVALGKAKESVFFSTLRKIIILTPLAVVLPRMFGLGSMGVFLAEPVSNILGGAASYLTMLFSLMPELRKKETAQKSMKEESTN